MSYVENDLVRGRLDKRISRDVKIPIEFTSDSAGDAGSLFLDIGASLVGVETTAECDVVIETVDGVDLLGTNGTDLTGRITPTEPISIVDGINITITNAPVSATNKLILYARN